MKRCTKCGEIKPLSEFGNHRLTKDGLAYRCKQCAREHARKHRGTPRGIYNQLKGQSNFFERSPLIISKEDFVKWHESEPKICVYCDILEEDLHIMNDYYRPNTKHKPDSRLTIDRVDNDEGYVAGNMVLACGRCNFLKSNLLTFEEMVFFGQTYIKPKWQALKDSRVNKE
jgi:hypothetical protein